MKKLFLWKIVLVLIILMVVSFLFTSCKKEKAKETVTLNFVGWEVSPLETESVKKGLEIFMSRNPHIIVNYNPIPHDQYTSKILTMMIANNCPDVFFTFAYDYRSFIKGGRLLDLTDRFKKEYNIDDYIPSSAKIMQVDGRVYGISSCTVSPVLYYNKELFDKAGMDYPPSDPAKAWTWNEFLNVAKKLTIVKDGKTVQYGVYGLENSYMFSALIMSNGGRYFNDDVTKCTINSPETAEVMQAILDLRKVHGASFVASQIMPDVPISAAEMLQTGKIAMLVDGSWALQQLATMEFEVGVGVLPKFKEAITHGQAHVHAAWAKTPHPEEAWALINFLSGDDYLLANIKAGLWMPHKKEYYTKKGIAKWYNPDVHPEGFKDMAPYFINALVEPTALNTKKKVNDILFEEIDKFLTGNKPINTVLTNLEKRANIELAKQ